MRGATPVRIGVIGAERIGRLHAELVAMRVFGAILAMISDVVPEAARGLGTVLAVPVATHRANSSTWRTLTP